MTAPDTEEYNDPNVYYFKADENPETIKKDNPVRELFTGTIKKFSSKSAKQVLSDFVDRNEEYIGKAASLADIPSETDGVTGVLDDPGVLSLYHPYQQYPDGTWTVHKVKLDTFKIPGNWKYTHYEYRATFMRNTGKGAKGGGTWVWNFQNVGTYYTKAYNVIDQMIKNTNVPAFVRDLGDKGGYWYKGKKVQKISKK